MNVLPCGPCLSRRSGVVLPAALAAIILIGIVVSAVFFASRQRTLISIALADGTRAAALADMGESRGWRWLGSAAPGDLAAGETATAAPLNHVDGTAAVHLTRLNDRIFVMISEGHGRGGIVRRTVTYVQLASPGSLSDSLTADPIAFIPAKVALRSWAEVF